jgi:hypothetical protein
MSLKIFLNTSMRICLSRLWLPEFLGIWESVCNNPDWEQVSSFNNVVH